MARRYSPDAAWDAVLPLAEDISAIVRQAHAARRIAPDYTDNDALSYLVERTVAWDGDEIRDYTAWALGTLRRRLLVDLTHVTDALDRATLQGRTFDVNDSLDGDGEDGDDGPSARIVREIAAGEDKAKREVFKPMAEIAALDCLTALEKRVASLTSAGKTIWRIGRAVGMRQNAVRRMQGRIAAKIRRRPD